MRTLALLALAFVPACGGHAVSIEVERWVSHPSPGGRLFDFGEHAEELRQLELPLAPGETFTVADTSADVHVTVKPADEGSPGVRAHIQAYAHSEARAEEVLKLVRVSIERTGNGCRIVVEQPAGTEAWTWDGARDYALGLVFEVALPPASHLVADVRNGTVQANGPLASCRATTDFGAITVDGALGSVHVEADSGAVSTRNVNADRVHARSSFGAVSCTDVNAPEIELRSSSGSISAERIRSASLQAHSDFGAISLTDVTGIVTGSTDSGHITATDAQTSLLDLSSDFGGITVARSTGSLVLNTDSGGIEVHESNGSIEAHTDFGGITVDGTFPSLVLSTDSGSVNARVRNVGTPRTPWKLSSDFGAVTLTVPRGFAAIIDAATDFGGISANVDGLDAKVERDGGGARLHGVVGGGAQTVRVRTDSGSVNLHSAD